MVAKKSNQSDKPVTRITASVSKKSKPAKSDKPSETTAAPAMSKAPSRDSSKRRMNPFSAFAQYFKGAWYELKQVRWPSRGATWSLTGAVLAFTAFFIVLILLLDAFFKYIFELILQ